jgi:hypothetical protein
VDIRKATYKITLVEVGYLNNKKPGVLIEFPDWGEWGTMLEPSLFEQISDWCGRNRCGHRIAYDEFIFDNEQQRAMFILRWS